MILRVTQEEFDLIEDTREDVFWHYTGRFYIWCGELYAGKGVHGYTTPVTLVIKPLSPKCEATYEIDYNEIKVNDVLFTKDGQRVGNCIVTEITDDYVTLKSDYGNSVGTLKVTLPYYFKSSKPAHKSHKYYVKEKEYKVRLEFDVKTSEFMDVTVNANNKQDAIQKAIEKYTENPNESSMYSGDYYEATLDTQTKADWDVEELVHGS